MAVMTTIQEADQYMHDRTGRYEWRAVRYRAALAAMQALGLSDRDTVLDVGAGWTELDYCLRVDGGWKGRYIPLDRGIDGTDLEFWGAPRRYEYAVALELLEHLENPRWMVEELQRVCYGIVVSVPNPRTVDVLGIDPTHVSIITADWLEALGFYVTEQTFYGGRWSNGEPDSLLGVWRA